MNIKKIAAAAVAAASALLPLSTGNLSAFVPSSVFAAEHGMGAALPQWIPSDYDSALEFRNTYGATLIKDGLVCIVFREHYEKVPEGEPQGVLRYEIRTTKGMMQELKHATYGSEESGYSYEVVVYYAPQETGRFEVALVDTWIKSTDLDLGYNHAVAYYSFLIGEDKSITETDIYSWLPDCITEYDDYVSKKGIVSSKDEFVVFCLDSSSGTNYKWYEPNENYQNVFKLERITDCSSEKEKEPDGGAVKDIRVYKAVKNGSARIQWNYVPSHDYGELEVRKTLIADCTVLDDMHVIVDDSYVQNADFRVSQYSIYSDALTSSSYSIYDKFSKSESAVITSEKELSGFLSEYLSEKALNIFVSQYSEDFFEDNVLMLNTYLDPYRGRVFKHGLDSVYYKDDKLMIDFASVVSANLMRTSYFSVLQLVVPRKYFNDECDVVWNCKEVLNYDLKRISVIDEDTGEHIAIPRQNVLDMFGYEMKYFEGRNPYYWDTEFYTGDWRKLSLDEKFLPEGYELSKELPKEIKEYSYNNADIIFRVKKTKPIELTYAIDKISTITPELFAEEPFMAEKNAAVSSVEELSAAVSFMTEEYRKKFFSAYDEDFFKDNILLLNFFIDSTGGDKIKITDSNVTADKITVYYNKPAPDFSVCNTDYLFILQASVPKDRFLAQKTEWKCNGDANGDGDFGIADLVTLQKWLIKAHDAELADWRTADLCRDSVLDSFDLVAMRKLLISVHQLESSRQYAIEAQYIRTNGYVSGAKYPQAKLITSTEELQSYIEANNDTYNLESSGFTKAVEKYTDSWFRSCKLIAVLLEEPSGSIRHEVTELTDKYVTINRIEPEVGTCDMAEWHILLEISKNADISDGFAVNLTKSRPVE